MKYKFLSKNILMQAGQALALKHNTLFNVRDEGMLDSALARPLNRYKYDKKATVYDLASEYAYGIIKNHPFTDGNKRLSFLACRLFLLLNDFDINEKLSEDAKYDMIIALASSNLSLDNFSKLIAIPKVSFIDGNNLSKLQYNILGNQCPELETYVWHSKRISRMYYFSLFDRNEKTSDTYREKKLNMVGVIKSVDYQFKDNKILANLNVVDVLGNFEDQIIFVADQNTVDNNNFVCGVPLMFNCLAKANSSEENKKYFIKTIKKIRLKSSLNSNERN